MNDHQTVTIYTSKNPYSKWAWPIAEGTYTGQELYKAVRAPLWGSMAYTRADGSFLTIERNDTYTIPDDIPADAVLRSNW